jgi:organic radical activating enzyme
MDIREFLKTNKSYCGQAFSVMNSSSEGQYRLCCHSKVNKSIRKYNVNNTLPFDFWSSPEMEEIRMDMIDGNPIHGCQICYDLEERGARSWRQQYTEQQHFTIHEDAVVINLRVHGSYCNLGCYMCIPYNSSTRRSELKKVFGKQQIVEEFQNIAVTPNNTRWKEILKNILDNTDKIVGFAILGGEPLQMERMWEMLDAVPDEDAKRMCIWFDSNLTDIKWKNHSLFDLFDKFKRVEIKVSIDHYQDKLRWMRYPIDVMKLEMNLNDVKQYITQISCTVSMLNAFDLDDIYHYYKESFDLETDFKRLVIGPRFLSIRNFSLAHKDKIRDMYRDKPFIDMNYINDELNKPVIPGGWDQAISYCDRLSAHRNFDWRGLWNDFT